jgi:hypothetical protein
MAPRLSEPSQQLDDRHEQFQRFAERQVSRERRTRQGEADLDRDRERGVPAIGDQLPGISGDTSGLACGP